MESAGWGTQVNFLGRRRLVLGNKGDGLSAILPRPRGPGRGVGLTPFLWTRDERGRHVLKWSRATGPVASGP